MLNGWIKIHRKLIDHWLFKEHRPKTKLEAWLIILLECNHSDSKVLINGTLIDCKTGQSVRSIATWSKEFKWTYAKVRSFFKLLEKDNMIVLEGFANTTRLSICNYDSYQKTKQTDDKQKTSKKQTENNKQECKEEKEIIINSSFSEICLNDAQWFEITSMQNKGKNIKEFISKFDKHLITLQEQKKNVKEYKQHFINWLAKQPKQTNGKINLGI